MLFGRWYRHFFHGSSRPEDDSARQGNEGCGMRASSVWLFCVYDVRLVSYLDQNHAATRAEHASRRPTRPRPLTSPGDVISAFAHGATRETAAHGLQTTVPDRVKRCPDRPRSGTDGTGSESSALLAWEDSRGLLHHCCYTTTRVKHYRFTTWSLSVM